MDFLALADSLISGFLYGILCRQQICVKRMASPVWETVLFFLVLVGTYQVMSLLNLPLASEPIAALSAFCYFHLICKSPVRNTAGMVLLLFLLHFGSHTFKETFVILLGTSKVVFLFLIFEILAAAVLLCSKRMNRVFQLEKESHFLKAELLFLGLFALNRLLVCTQESSAIHMISLISSIVSAVLFYLWIWRELRCQSRERTLNESLVAERHRNRPLRLALEELANLSQEASAEFRPELERLEKERRDQHLKEWQKNYPVPETGIILLDGLLRQFLKRAEKDQILFQIVLREPPSLLISELGIGLDSLLRSIGDLLLNAFEAVNRKGVEENRLILLCMGKTVSGIYEIDLLDSGVPFTDRVWENLGLRGNTTGGTGNGMADLVETLQQWRASLTLHENPDNSYTKKLTISFCGEYRIRRIFGEESESRLESS